MHYISLYASILQVAGLISFDVVKVEKNLQIK